MPQVIDVAAKLKIALMGISDLVRQYDLLSEDDQKATRHLLYKQTGKYGKAFTKNFLPIVQEVNKKLSGAVEP
jgi:hypothetical protein